MPAQALEYYRLTEPEWAVCIGQGDPPTGPTVTVDGVSHTFAWGETVQCSSSASTTPGIGNVEVSPKKVLASIIDDWGIIGERDGAICEHLPEYE